MKIFLILTILFGSILSGSTQTNGKELNNDYQDQGDIDGNYCKVDGQSSNDIISNIHEFSDGMKKMNTNQEEQFRKLLSLICKLSIQIVNNPSFFSVSKLALEYQSKIDNQMKQIEMASPKDTNRELTPAEFHFKTVDLLEYITNESAKQSKSMRSIKNGDLEYKQEISDFFDNVFKTSTMTNAGPFINWNIVKFGDEFMKDKAMMIFAKLRKLVNFVVIKGIVMFGFDKYKAKAKRRQQEIEERKAKSSGAQ